MIRTLALVLALGLSAPAIAAIAAIAANEAAELAEQRLRGCLLAGASAAPQPGLEAAIVSTRAFCGTQIRRVRDNRVKAATAGLSGEDRKAAEDRTIRALNNEIAVTIANLTGLTS